jgi:HAE1 family hydrophobic/amphiphilic exporter-1
MNLPELGVKRPVTTFAVFTVILILGFVSLSMLGIDLMPDITLPAISITTVYPGAGPEDVETRISKVIEDAVSTVPNVDRVTSISQENISAVIVYFSWGTNIDNASMDVRDAMGFINPFMPDDAQDPLIFKFDASTMPILFLGISAEESYPELYDLVDKKLADPLRRVPGVGSASPYGGLERQINVRINGAALVSRGLSIDQITGMLQAANITLPAGNVKIGSKDYVIRLPGEFRTVQEIADVVIGSSGGMPIYLRDVAEVEDGFMEIQRISRMDGRSSVMMVVQKQSGANTVEVAEAVWKKIDEIRPSLPKDVEIKGVFDGSVFIKQSIASLARTVLWAAFLIILVVFFFLRSLRSSVIIAFTLPFSLIVAFILLYAANYTINIMSLSSLAIAIGMVVDNGIVVFENIYRHRTQFGEGARESAVFGSREVAMAITASTLTTVVIFVPLLFVQGIAGILFRQLGFVIMFVLAASLFTALYLTPTLSSRWLKGEINSGFNSRKRGKPTLYQRLFQASETMFTWVENRYRNLLHWTITHKLITVLAALLIFIVSMMLMRFVHTEFFPHSDQSELTGIVELPLGTRLEETDRIMKEVEAIIQEEAPERQVIIARCGTSRFGWGVAMGQGEGDNLITIQGTLIPKAERSASDLEIGYRLSQRISHLPGVKTVDFTPSDPFTAMFGGGKPIQVEVYGFDIDETDRVAQEIADILNRIPGTSDVVISRGEGKPEYWVEVDRRKAASVGLTVGQIAVTLRNNFYGNDDVKFREAGEEYPIFVQLQEEDRKDLADIGDVMVTSPMETLVPLKAMAHIERRIAPVRLERKNQQRMVNVSCGIIGRAMGAVAGDIRRELDRMNIPKDVEIHLAGSIEEQAESFRDLMFAMLLGIVLVYLVMAAQFESLLDPFIIMFAIPFAMVGVVWAFLITGLILSINAFIGMIMLVGIVVNNGIVLVDYINLMRARGLGLAEAILTSGQRRLRPVLMTTLTTVFGLLPLALSRAEGSESWVPLGVAVIGGLLVSTLITLVLIPTLYAVFEARLKGKRISRKREG